MMHAMSSSLLLKGFVSCSRKWSVTFVVLLGFNDHPLLLSSNNACVVSSNVSLAIIQACKITLVL